MSIKTLLHVSVWGLLLVGIIAGCQEPDEDSPLETTEYEVQQPKQPLMRGQRRLGITPSESEQGFLASFTELQKVGVNVVELNLEWSYFESSKGQYHDPNELLQAIGFYGEQEIEVGLSLATINTVQRTDPAYLQNKSFDDPAYIDAFTNLLDWILAHMAEQVTLDYISVGNEVDIYLSSEDWDAYQTFVQAAISHIHKVAPQVKAGAKVTVMHGLFGDVKEQVKELINHSDVAMLNYYPQDDAFQVLEPAIVETHFARIVDDVQKPIYFTEVGYQSGGKYCQSSEAKQAEFYHTLFGTWDTYQDNIQVININWLHDASPTQVAAWEEYYGSSAESFVEYLSTLGVRNYNHTDKAAWLQIQADTQSRGW